MREKINILIDYRKLIKMCHTFQNNPLKVFVKKDFARGNDKNLPSYLFVLEKLRVIEIVPVKYKTGKKYIITRNTKGYRLKSH